MTIFNEGRGKVIDVNPNPFLRFVGLAIAAFLLVILLFSAITRESPDSTTFALVYLVLHLPSG